MRPLVYTQHGLAAAIDRHDLRRQAHFVGMSLIMMVVCMQVLAAVPLFMMAGMGMLDLTADNYGLSSDAMSLLNMGIYLLTLAPPVVVTALICKQRIHPFGQHRRVEPLSFVYLVGMGLAVCILANFVANFFAGVLSQFGVGWPDATGDVESTGSSLLIHLFATAIIPGILEEMVFRGYILQALRPYGDGFAVAVSALLFGLLHGNVLQSPFALIVGLVCGYVVVQTGNIWTSITLHTLNNAMAVVLTFFTGRMSQAAATRLDMIVSLLVAVLGVACYLALKASESPLLDRPSAGWTSLSAREKWGGLLSSPAFVVALVLLVLMTLLNTLSYSVL